MNTNTGAVYELGEEFAAKLPALPMDVGLDGYSETATALHELARTKHELAAAEAIARGDHVVPVSHEVVQQVQLGRRELERRRRRRQQTRESRRRNR